MNIYLKVIASATVLAVFWTMAIATSPAIPPAANIQFINGSETCTIHDFSFRFSDVHIVSDTQNLTVILQPNDTFTYEAIGVDTLIGVRYNCDCPDSGIKIGEYPVKVEPSKTIAIRLDCQ
ncbi:MAG: hypothetical protein K9J37_09765 [Saprospiraceae bacterium]|nr:hypothetical protein [Saprospiraceae bacterium]MCF8250190.1 hypothetical protein [Saprospiraceae bacterium]MCF8280047.1 hypothetical protein [Bacteroidales bacterium]MCF8311998.1 hypothetical protein [Saprospiraceae bacterium]MCF8441095.1 hypothetical protein [Saprospiraceae bacterium]